MARLSLALLGVLAAVAGALPPAAAAQDFEPVDLQRLETLLEIAEQADREAAERAGREDPDPSAPGGGAGAEPMPDSDSEYVRLLLLRLRAIEAAAGLPPAGGPGLLSDEEQAALEAMEERLGLGRARPFGPAGPQRFHAGGGTSTACVGAGHAAYGRYPGVGGISPPPDRPARLSANPLPAVGGPVAWLDSRAPATGCGGLGWSAVVDVRVVSGFFAGLALSGTTAVHELEFDGEIPSVLVSGTVHPFDGTREVGSRERRVLLRAGWRAVGARTDYHAVAAFGRTFVAFEVGADAEGMFYAPGGVASFSGGGEQPVEVDLVVEERSRSLPVVQVGGGVTRWLSRFVGAAVEVGYFKTFGGSISAPPPRDDTAEPGAAWSYGLRGWSADARLRVRF